VCVLQVASFLRSQHDNLDKAQLGELLGHHDDFAIAVMHAWIDSEPSMAGQAVDQSLRRMLAGFRLPGEAQKIDRIMEKFAEVGTEGMVGAGLIWVLANMHAEHVSKHHVTYQARDNKHRNFLFHEEVSRGGKATHRDD